jgi:hypothetical protein
MVASVLFCLQNHIMHTQYLIMSIEQFLLDDIKTIKCQTSHSFIMNH